MKTQARLKRENDGPASRSVLASMLGQHGDPVGTAQQRSILAKQRGLHQRAGYEGRKRGHLQFVASLPTEQTFLWKSLEVLLEAFEVSGFQRGSPSSVLETTAQRRLLNHWTELAAAIAPGLEGAFKLLKYKLAAFFSACMDVDLPKRPFPERFTDNPLQVVGGRRARRFVHSIKRASVDPQASQAFDRLLTLAVNVLQAKKGLPRPDQAMLASAALKTFNELSTTRQSPTLCFLTGRHVHPSQIVNERWGDMPEEEADVTERLLNWKVVRDEVRRTVQELLPRNGYTLADRMRPFFPSTSANYISSRSNAGAVGAILDEHSYVLEGLRRPDSGVDVKHAGEEGRGVRTEFDVDYTAMQKRFDVFYTRVIADAVTEPAFAQPVALAEALKTRVITKGPALLNTALKPLQRFLWTALSKHRCFQLIGRPVDARVLLHVLGAELGPDQSFVSGDYSNATNEIDARISNLIVDEIAEWCGLTEVERQLFRRSLTEHTLSLDGKTAPQRNGQLMGSVTSFPVLCIANFAICRLAMEVGADSRLATSSLPLLVNGDDCLFRTNERGRVAWERAAAFVGLTPSVGKCYVSRRFVNVNSTNFAFSRLHLREERWLRGTHKVCPSEPSATEKPENVVLRHNPFRLTRFVNFGLLYGLKRSGGAIGLDDLADPMDGIGARHRELLGSCPEESTSFVNDIFFRHHLPALKRARVPWYLPEWLGGLGLVGPQDEFSLKLAFWAITNWAAMKTRPADAKGDQPWRVRQLCKERYLRDLPTQNLDAAQSEQEDRVLGLLCAATILDSRVALADIFRSGSEGRAILRHNEKFWNSLREASRTRPLPPAPDIDGGSPARAFQATVWSMQRPRCGVAFGNVTAAQRFPAGFSVDFQVIVDTQIRAYWERGIAKAEQRLQELDAGPLAPVAAEEKLVGYTMRRLTPAQAQEELLQRSENWGPKGHPLLTTAEQKVSPPLALKVDESLWSEAKRAGGLRRRQKPVKSSVWEDLDSPLTLEEKKSDHELDVGGWNRTLVVGTHKWVRALQLKSNSDYLLHQKLRREYDLANEAFDDKIRYIESAPMEAAARGGLSDRKERLALQYAETRLEALERRLDSKHFGHLL